MLQNDSTPENTGRKQDGTFNRGVTGNPGGRPKGSLNKSTLAAQKLLEGQAETLTQTAIDLAHSGNTVALRLCIDRLLPVRRRAPISIDLGKLETAEDAHRAFSVVAEALRDGRASADDIAAISKLLEQFLKTTELVEFELRVTAIEEVIENASKDQPRLS